MDPTVAARTSSRASRHRGIKVAGTTACLLIAGLALTISFSVHPATAPTRSDRIAADLLQARTPDPADVERVSELTRVSLAHRPLDGAALLRVAYLSTLASGELDQTANQAILRSYVVEPLGSEITLWRLGFILDHWSSASPDVRQAALGEFRAVYPRRSWDFDALARTARDPEGRMVGGLIARQLRRAMDAKASAAPA